MCSVRMRNNTLYSLEQRISQFLVENTNEKGKASMPLSAEQLSEHMGVTTRSVNRVLKELKDQNIRRWCAFRSSFADIAQTIAECLGIPYEGDGESFLTSIE